ncbi:MAG: 50S ribosomal protein L25 [Acidobacteria bacterium]|uniref:Large ribosomal subunit protein bL25 n=1 Tax=Candidatus Polarisedimenticola svalbardensis TaxID=2886004 RepID=A0A8J6XZN6_9BACT|nr:50S ribosomal protein L25 [Candidatus Polarisedimenticola svalbardensis]
MISKSVVEVQPREERGKGPAGRLRAAGRIPGIVYGMAKDSFAVAVQPRNIELILRSETGFNTIFNLSLGTGDKNAKRAVMLKELQRDPVTDRLVHVDFVRVDLDTKVTVDIPIRIIGESIGVTLEFGTMDVITRSVQVECLPNDIPDALELDVSELHVGQHASVADLKAPEGVTLLIADDTTVLNIAHQRAEEVVEEEVLEGEEGAEVAEGEEAPADGEEKKEES